MRQNKITRTARRMPALRHSIQGEDFDIEKSEVIKWLLSQPEIKQGVFEMAANKKSIVYDQTTREWKGADYET